MLYVVPFLCLLMLLDVSLPSMIHLSCRLHRRDGGTQLRPKGLSSSGRGTSFALPSIKPTSVLPLASVVWRWAKTAMALNTV